MLRWFTLTFVLFAKYTELCCVEDVGTPSDAAVPSEAVGCGCQSLKREAGVVGTGDGGMTDAPVKPDAKYSQSLNEMPSNLREVDDTKSQVVNTTDLI